MSAIHDEWTTEDGSVRLLLGDCLEILPQIGKVDAVVTDPPYGLQIEYEGFEDTQSAVSALAEKWLPACIALAGVVAFSPGKLNEWLYPRPSWVLGWASKSGQGGTPWGFPCYWPILVYGKDPYLSNGLGRRPDTFFIDTVAKEKIDHPCPKPTEVMEWLVERVDPFAGVILDPFMGSGTTGVACIRLNRRFVGIEKEPKYFEIAKKRIQNELAKTALIETPKRLVQTSFMEAVDQ